MTSRLNQSEYRLCMPPPLWQNLVKDPTAISAKNTTYIQVLTLHTNKPKYRTCKTTDEKLWHARPGDGTRCPEDRTEIMIAKHVLNPNRKINMTLEEPIQANFQVAQHWKVRDTMRIGHGTSLGRLAISRIYKWFKHIGTKCKSSFRWSSLTR